MRLIVEDGDKKTVYEGVLLYKEDTVEVLDTTDMSRGYIGTRSGRGEVVLRFQYTNGPADR